jgi:adenylate cyclase
MDPSLALVPSTLVAVVAIGMGLSFYSADPESPISRMLAIAFVALGIAVGFEVPIRLIADVPWWGRWMAIVDLICFWAFLEWILLVRHTVPAGTLNTRFGDRAIRVAQAASVVYAIAGLLAPELKYRAFLGSLSAGSVAVTQFGFWLFAGPALIAAFAGIGGAALFLRRRPDVAEQARILGMIAATPFIVASLVLPFWMASLSSMVGLVLFMAGAVQYHVLQGKRGEFMARFLSPKVAELVRRRGLASAMQDIDVELTAVCVDLRGFTAYAQAVGSASVVQVLREYYHVAGEVVARYDGTIKDLAGDGILILVGAPLAVADHGQRGLEMAGAICAAVSRAATGWSSGSNRLGVGIGVASGAVIVGAIEAGERYEYTAVGMAVNLASRLCEEAADGEILVAQRTFELCPRGGEAPALERRAPISVKGFAEPVLHHCLRVAALAPA